LPLGKNTEIKNYVPLIGNLRPMMPVPNSSDFIHQLLLDRLLVKMIKSLTAREIFKKCPHVKKQLWGGEFWSDGYFASTVGKHGDENMISKYVKKQGGEYVKLHQCQQLWFTGSVVSAGFALSRAMTVENFPLIPCCQQTSSLFFGTDILGVTVLLLSHR